MPTTSTDPTGRFATRTISDLLAYLEHHLPTDEMVALLEEAGETRPVAEVRRDAVWTSRDWYSRLVTAAGEHLGGARELEKVVPWANEHTTPPEFLAAIRSVGSPQAMLQGLAHSISAFDPAIVIEIDEGTATSWTVDLRHRAGIPALPGTCALYRGLISGAPTLFGDHPAAVVELTCQCEGAPSCRFAVTFSPAGEDERRVSLLELDARVQRARLEHLQQVVQEIGNGTRPLETLHRILVTVMTATAATGAVLAGRDGDRLVVVSEGLDDASARELGAALLDEEVAERDILIAEVISAGRQHGVLAVLGVRPALHPVVQQILVTYAHLAAGVLDIQRAVEATRRQAQTATALLELAVSLSELDSPPHLARRLARGIPRLIGFDRAAVFLADSDGQPPHLAAGHGYVLGGPEPVLPIGVEDATGPRFVESGELPLTRPARCVLAPLGIGKHRFGWLLAEADEPATATRAAAEVLALTAGAAAQATIALTNARLLDQVSHQALHDPLTGLGNRALVLDRTQAAISHRRANRKVAVLLLDLDGFKMVNDSLGHAAGDEVLCAVADRLRAVTRQEDLVGRMGGDEFVVLIQETSAESDPEILAERILAVLGEPYPLTDPRPETITLTVSIGITIGTDSSAGDLLRDADIALYRAKESGKNRVVLFETAMHASRQARHQLEVDLRTALTANELFLLWQPTFDLGQGSIRSAEALLRWQHPLHGTIAPAILIPLLEETGLILPVGRWVLATACAQANTWRAAGFPIPVSVNISPRQLANEQFVDDVIDIVTASGLDPTHLVLEISEATLMGDIDTAAVRLHRLKAAGIGIAVDNFGTAYSSLGQLSTLPIDVIKIDRSLISAIAGNTGVRTLVHTLVEMGHALGIETLADGVEVAAQDSQVRAEAFDTVQGFLFAPPLPANDIAQLLRAETTEGSGPAPITT